MIFKDLLNEDLASQIDSETAGLGIQDTLRTLSSRFQGEIAFSTSFGQEDQVIADMIFTPDLPILVFTLDTGRHFEETYKVMNQTLAKYNKKIKVCFPDKDQVEKLMTQKGPFSFYESVENRRECCHIRKVEPMQKILSQVSCWITGLRASQSDARRTLKRFSYDAANQVIKYNPLIEWSIDQVKDYLKLNHVPYNVLHDRGFLSIGCAPCTRAVAEGEDIRAGRWWWENNKSKECGLHQNDQE
ncbi:MAG: phosphoadenylyl-sulfate reductase [Porphyromonadaceae bacterium]|nr:MAG: phosphoadenylyl-sulfate reductase [Porphyromonadaceae bacterium]